MKRTDLSLICQSVFFVLAYELDPPKNVFGFMTFFQWIPPYRKLPFPSSYAWWLIPMTLIVITFQVSEIESGEITFSYHRTVLLCIYYGVWLALAPFLYGLLFLYDQHNKSIAFIGWILFLTLILQVTHLLVSNLLLSLSQELLFDRPPTYFYQLKGIWPALIFNRIVTMVLMVLILKVIDNFRQLQSTRLQLSDAQNQLQQSQLERLQSQLNPHFLFNSLHAITSLIGFDDPKARELTVHLSDMLRTNLEKEQQPFQTIEEEINYIRAYAAIQQERFRDWVTITIHVDKDIQMVQIPSLLLQPLVENAFIHGVDGLTEKGYLSIAITSGDDQASIIIKNSTHPAHHSAGSTGLGLANVRMRLELLYEGKASIRVDHQPEEFQVELKLPIA